MKKLFAKDKSFEIIISLYNHLNEKRKLQLTLLIFLNFFSSISESISIVSVFPVLSSLSRSDIKYNFFLFDKISNQENSLLIFVLLFILFIVIAQILKITNIYLNQRFAALIGYEFSSLSYKKLINREYTSFLDTSSSNAINSLASNVDSLVIGIRYILNGMTFLIISIFLILTSSIINIKLTVLLLLILVSSYALIGKILSKRVLINSNLLVFLTQKIIKTIQESFGHIRDIILNDNHDFYYKNYKVTERKRKLRQAENQFYAYFPKYIIETIGILILSLFAYFIFKDNSNNQSISLVGLFALAFQRLLPSAQIVYLSWIGVRGHYSAIKNILEIIDSTKNKEIINTKKKIKIIFKKKIILENISYSYPNTKKSLLKKINLEICKGDFIGISGKTGEGKSTLIDIITGILSPLNGNMYIDDLEILGKQNSNYILNSWRNKISYVPQDIFISEGSIIENIALGKDPNLINIKRIERVTKITNLKTLISGLPEKIYTNLGENGVKLSGGQKQRIGIARGLFKNSDLLILDEATSGLDNETEKIILKNILKMNNQITVIMISHRKTSLEYCNKIFNLEKGYLREIK